MQQCRKNTLPDSILQFTEAKQKLVDQSYTVAIQLLISVRIQGETEVERFPEYNVSVARAFGILSALAASGIVTTLVPS